MSLKPEARAEGMEVGGKTRGFPQLALRASKQRFCRGMSFAELRSGTHVLEARGASRGDGGWEQNTRIPSAHASGFEAGTFLRVPRPLPANVPLQTEERDFSRGKVDELVETRVGAAVPRPRWCCQREDKVS